MPEVHLYSANSELIKEIEDTFPPPPSPTQFSFLSQEMHVEDKGILITRSYHDRDAFAGILYMRGILDGITIWLELNVSFATGSNTDFGVLLKIENPFIIENTWQYKIMNNKLI